MIRMLGFVGCATCVLLLEVVVVTSLLQSNATTDRNETEHCKNDVTAATSVSSALDARTLGCSMILLPNGDNIEDYIAPYDIPNKFVYYQAGYDFENRPVWVAELGKWPVKEVFQEGHEKEFDWHLLQFLHRAFKSIHDKSTLESPVREVVFILDFSGQTLDQIAHIPAAKYALSFVNKALGSLEKYLHECVVVNTNFAAETFINLVRPVFGGVFERVTIYGNNKASWVPKLLRKIPAKSLPEWYGGVNGYTPMKVYG